MRTIKLMLLTAAVAAVTVAPVSSPAAPTRPTGRLVPATGAYFGAYVNGSRDQYQNTAAAIAEAADYETLIGRKLDIHLHFYGWEDWFPSYRERDDLENGRIPLISWKGTKLDEINSGMHDELIQRRAWEVAALHQPVFLRWGYEMNGNWNTWGGPANNDEGQTNGPEKYVAAWRRIHSIFRRNGATNVVWVWTPNHESIPPAWNNPWNDHKRYYPGDKYVDWVGIDGYNWGTVRSFSGWWEISRILKNVYPDYADRKPIMLPEIASVHTGGENVGGKPGWIERARDLLKTEYPSVAAFVWFHHPEGYGTSYYHEEFLVTQPPEAQPAALDAYTAMGLDPYFRPPAVTCLGERADVIGTAAPETFRLPRVTSSVSAGGGRDRVYGHVLHDHACGGAGDDRLYGGRGDDLLAGNGGHDMANGEAGRDHAQGGDGNDVLRGGPGDDHLGGGRGRDALDGGGGHDRLRGDGGRDLLRGRTGRDHLAGGAGNDALYDGRGQDVVDGGPGYDVWYPCDDGERDRRRSVERVMRPRASYC